MTGEGLLFLSGTGRLAAERHPGGSPTVVALHAGVADRRAWRSVADALQGVVTFVSYDRRGYGETPASSTRFSHLADLTAVLDELGADPVWLLGNSMGGGLALDLTLEMPARVAGLILLSPGISGAPERPLDPDTQRLADAIDPAFEAGDMELVNRLEMWLWLDGPAQPQGRVKEPMRTLATAMNAIVLANEERQLELEDKPEIDAWSRLGEIPVPVTVACGMLDVPAMIADGRALAEAAPHGRFVALEGMAHLPSLEAPETVAALIAEAVAPGDG
jgi:pimeloyl-ACP methyl ester carboxylesterase